MRNSGVAGCYALPEGNVQIAFSGGRSSAYMLHEILQANGPLPDRVAVTFQNTGRERPETLDFVQEVGQRWGVNIVWLEYGPDSSFAIVNRETASEDGKPFETLIRKRKFLPNQQARFCTVELKIRTAKRYLMSLGWKHWTNATGIRADEPHRLNKAPPKDRWTVWMPLADAGVSKRTVTAFWAAQPFDLRLQNIDGKTPDGNCDDCFLKSERHKARIAIEYPERHAWWEGMEELASTLTSGTGAQFSSRYSMKEIRLFVENQGTLDLNDTALLCQANDGECF
jgi:3'-phosphoadenosine 5'-phosphosulfate sulfotransferase (PAPS reductase)/FAD synthetase